MLERGFIKKNEMTPDMYWANAYNNEALDKENSGDASGTPQYDEQPYFLTMMVIRQNSGFSFVWNNLYVIACLITSYMYVWIAAYGHFSITHQIELGFEIFFLLHVLKNCFTEYTPEGETNSVRHIASIISRYFHNDFIYHLIPLIPFTILLHEVDPRVKLFYLIKIVRLNDGIKVFSIRQLLSFISE